MNEVNNNCSPTISVIVPVYNAEKTIRQCVDSILNQEYKYLELILVDDGSKDGSPAICDEYAGKDKRVKVFHKENGGVSSARNLGLNHAQGGWITFVDSDDYIDPDYFVNIEIYGQYDLIIKNYKWIRGTKTRVDHRIDSYASLTNDSCIRDFFNKYLTTMFFRGNVAKIYKKNCIAGKRFNEKMKVGEDANFVLNCLLNINSIFVSHDSCYCVRSSENTPANKYGATTAYAIDSLNYLFESFSLLRKKWDVNKGLFYSYLIYFKNISRNDWKHKPSKWYRNKDIKKMYSYLWPDLAIIDKRKYLLIRFISIFW